MAKRSNAALNRQATIDKAYGVFLLWQCEAFITALQRARAGSDAARRHADVTRATSFATNQQAFADFQSALTFAANISKMLWPRGYRQIEKKDALARGRRLRKLLGIKAKDRVLFASPTIRNNFEHLDVRVDAWARRTTGKTLGLHALASDKVFDGVVDRADRFTRYDPERDILMMLDDKINLQKLEASVMRVWRRCVGLHRSIERFQEQQAAAP